MTNAYSYLRISTDKQTAGDGIRRQLDASKAYAEQHGLNLINELKDIGLSGYTGANSKEGDLGHFIKAVDEGQIPVGTVLLVENLDRLSRQAPITAINQFTNLLTKGIKIITLTDGIVYTKDSINSNIGQLFTSVMVMGRGHEESATKSVRGKASWIQRRKTILEKPMTSVVPKWLYLSDDGKEILIDEDKADIVREIFDRCIAGQGAYTITRDLNSNPQKYPPIAAAPHWNNSYILKILRNEAVYGLFQPCEKIDGKRIPVGDPVENYYPAVVTKETFLLAKSRRTGRLNNTGRKGESFSNLFTNLAYCSECGGSMAFKNKGVSPKGGKYLRCTNSLQKNGCSAPSWQYLDFENAFIAFCKEVKFSEIINNNKSISEELEKQKASLLDSKQKDQEIYNTLISRFGIKDLPAQVLDDLVKQSKELSEKMAAQDAELESIEKKIQEINQAGVDQDQKNFINAYDEIKKSEDDEKIRNLRYAMHSIMKRNIDYITVHCTFTDELLHPTDVHEIVPEKLIADAGKLKYPKVTDEELFDYFKTPNGHRILTAENRFFKIYFKNGNFRTVKPSAGSMFTNWKKMAKFMVNNASLDD
ncbi:recombinase family protein [Yoonia sp.]|uniref:recombinase family protein n=1 Tax=Yoonia sp. TaxID=2212373 RepID=UPI00391DBBF0